MTQSGTLRAQHRACRLCCLAETCPVPISSGAAGRSPCSPVMPPCSTRAAAWLVPCTYRCRQAVPLLPASPVPLPHTSCGVRSGHSAATSAAAAVVLPIPSSPMHTTPWLLWKPDTPDRAASAANWSQATATASAPTASACWHCCSDMAGPQWKACVPAHTCTGRQGWGSSRHSQCCHAMPRRCKGCSCCQAGWGHNSPTLLTWLPARVCCWCVPFCAARSWASGCL